MTGTHAPAQLPLAPKPLNAELLSSWLLRVAAQNHVSLYELIDGFTSKACSRCHRVAAPDELRKRPQAA
jgi:hypothetical protein